MFTYTSGNSNRNESLFCIELFLVQNNTEMYMWLGPYHYWVLFTWYGLGNKWAPYIHTGWGQYELGYMTMDCSCQDRLRPFFYIQKCPIKTTTGQLNTYHTIDSHKFNICLFICTLCSIKWIFQICWRFLYYLYIKQSLLHSQNLCYLLWIYSETEQAWLLILFDFLSIFWFIL